MQKLTKVKSSKKKTNKRAHASLVYKTVQYVNSSNILNACAITELIRPFKVSVVQKAVQILHKVQSWIQI